MRFAWKHRCPFSFFKGNTMLAGPHYNLYHSLPASFSGHSDFKKDSKVNGDFFPPNSALFDLETAPCSTLALQRLLSGPAPCHLLSGCGCSTQPAVEEGQGQSLRAWGTAWASWRFRSMMPGGLTLASSSSLPRLCMALPRSCMACFWVTLFCGSPVGRGLQPSPWLLLGPLLSLAACPILALRWLGVGCGGVGDVPCTA